MQYEGGEFRFMVKVVQFNLFWDGFYIFEKLFSSLLEKNSTTKLDQCLITEVMKHRSDMTGEAGIRL